MRIKRINYCHVGSLGSYKDLAQLGDSSLFLAPLVDFDIQYAEFFKNQARSQFTILDPGSLELAIGTEKKEINEVSLLKMAFELNVSEVICPDMPFDPEDSLKRSLSFLKLLRIKENHDQLRVMIVPHGRTVKEWLENCEILVKTIGKCTVGIPRVLAKATSNFDALFRHKIGQLVVAKFPNVEIHLLGAGTNFLDELDALKTNNLSIRSLDNTFLHRYSKCSIDPQSSYVPPVRLKDNSYCRKSKRRIMKLAKHFTKNSYDSTMSAL